MNWLNRILGTKDREQKERTEKVAEYVHKQKNTFSSEMGKIQNQAKKVHTKTKEVHEESKKLLEIVDSVTSQIAIATGGKKRGLR